MRCPVCQRQFSAADSPAVPFCSDRCRTIDLARWLDEKYPVPVEEPEDEEESSDMDQQDPGDAP